MAPIGSYLSQADFARNSNMSREAVVELEAREPGYLDRRLVLRSAEISSLLSKRYAVPLNMSEPPAMVIKWLVDLVTFDAFMKLGFGADDGNDAEIVKAKDEALAQLHEAADAKDGLYELPLREGDAANGISKTAPMSYSELSPYDAKYIQRNAVSRHASGRRRFS